MQHGNLLNLETEELPENNVLQFYFKIHLNYLKVQFSGTLSMFTLLDNHHRHPSLELFVNV